VSDDGARRLVELAEALARAGTAVPMAHELARQIHRGVVLEDALHRTIASAGETAENGVPAERHTIAIGTEGEPSGWLTVVGADADGSDIDLRLAMRVAAAALGDRLAASKTGRRTDFWTRLHAGAYRDAATARDDAGAYGVTLRAAYTAIAIEPDASVAPDARRDARDAIARAFHLEDTSVGAIEDAATTIVFVPSEREIDASNARANAELLAREAGRRKPPLLLWGGVGSSEHVAQVGESAKRALAALSIARRVFSEPRVAAYGSLGAYPLLFAGADARSLSEFARGVLAPLRAYDESHQTELERTLRTYFETGENLKVAAARLNVHRHTVLYRLRQIGEICNRSLENHHDQLALRVAIAVDALHT
jgi:DNA-binding PucR family transcriptional regulator